MATNDIAMSKKYQGSHAGPDVAWISCRAWSQPTTAQATVTTSSTRLLTTTPGRLIRRFSDVTPSSLSACGEKACSLIICWLNGSSSRGRRCGGELEAILGAFAGGIAAVAGVVQWQNISFPS
jgi:hypothetical protein